MPTVNADAPTITAAAIAPTNQRGHPGLPRRLM
jgi:hypothetical protein